jgi:hypothetical protein
VLVLQQIEHSQSRGEARSMLDGRRNSMIVQSAKGRIDDHVGALPLAPAREPELDLNTTVSQVLGYLLVIFVNTEVVHDR